MVRLRKESTAALAPFVLNGPTCDSLDILPGTFELPADIEDGDWIEIDRMGGLARRMPLVAAGFLLGAIAICGLPPLNGFISEWLIYLASFSGMF